MTVHFFDTVEEFNLWRSKNKKKSLGLIPTMGNLHKAHLTLLEQSLKDNQASVLTIFVNPKQFPEDDDFKKYPRTLANDIALATSLAEDMKATKKDIIIFAPEDTSEIYPKGFNENIESGKIGSILEGTFRKGHFNGMATVVYRLFKIFTPKRAYFGKKDYQQLHIIKNIVKDYSLKIKIVSMPVVRDESGLALSSRNQFLNKKQMLEALKLSQTIYETKYLLVHEGRELAQEFVSDVVQDNPAFNYLEIRAADSLLPITSKTKKMVILGNYQIESTRLLDNEEVKL